jgi:hypothetical protein
MRSRILIRLAAVALVALSVVACGGGGGDPTAPVKDLVNLVETKQFAKVSDLACAAEKADIAQRFDFTSAMAGGLGDGVDAQAVTDAMTVKFEEPLYKEVSKSGDKATVQLTGTLKVGFDQAKMAEVLKAALAAQGLPADDATIQAALGTMSTGLEQGQPVDSTVDLALENGKWLICGVTDKTQ